MYIQRARVHLLQETSHVQSSLVDQGAVYDSVALECSLSWDITPFVRWN